MSLANLKNNESTTSGTLNRGMELTPVRVFSVILDSSHPKYTGEDSIGTIYYGKVNSNESSSNLDNLNRARPLFSFVKYFPLQNEVVLVLNTTSRNVYKDVGGDGAFISTYYLPNINIWNNAHHNALPIEGSLKSRANSQEASLGIQQNNVETNVVTLGDYFAENPDLKNIQPFEGDLILEGRFGNSIRFGSSTPRGKNNWSENGSIGDPVTIIANGQPQVTGDTILEDINSIDSSIFMLSNQNINNFTPASLNLQSLGQTLAPTPNPQVLIVDTPDPPPTPAPEPIEFEPFVEEPITEEKPQTTSPPTEEEVTPRVDVDDPIFALLDEAIAEGEITEEISVQDVAGSSADPEDEFVGNVNETIPTDWSETNEKIVEEEASYAPPAPTTPATARKGVYLTNIVGRQVYIPPPDPNLTVARQNTRKIDYIFIHTTAGSLNATPPGVMSFFFRPDDPLKEGIQGRGWKTGGYHWLIEKNGDATRVYDDRTETNGARGRNKNSIHLNWIGGVPTIGLNMTQRQAYTLKRLILKYVEAYPDAKVIGHNQYSVKECPWFHVPTFAKNIGVNTNQIDFSDMNELPERYSKETGKLVSVGLSLEEAIRNANNISNGI